jgi:DNA adenine methylase
MNKKTKLRIPRPFLKWAGGKTQLLSEIACLLPTIKGRYIEPFVGGGALFFELEPERALIQDVNLELIDTYRVVRDHVDELIESLGTYKFEKEEYYRVRDSECYNIVNIAARMIYLNKTCFNGLYRVNSKGKFNVAMGDYKNPVICDAENLRACSRVLQGAEIQWGDFRSVESIVGPGDFVYFDPPYIPVSVTSNFTSYSKDNFPISSHEELLEIFKTLSDKGAYLMLTNSDTTWTRGKYADFHIHEVSAKRSINSKGTSRGKVSELIITNY